MTARKSRKSPGKEVYLVIWWMSKSPYAAVFENRVAAEAAANVRNAIWIRIQGEGIKVEEVMDWYRRDEEGRPMPAEWRELMGQIHAPWHAKSIVHADGVGSGLNTASDPVEA
jgi:hypothetical protein